MLKKRAKKALLWSSIDFLLRQSLQFGVSIALARMVAPAEFGVIAMLALFTGIASAFVDSGLSSALVHKRTVSHADESTVFWFNCIVAVGFALLLVALAPSLALFFHEPILLPLTRVLAFDVVIRGVGSVQGTLLDKQLNFKTHTKVGAIASITSGTVAMWMAWQGFGVWALAAQMLVRSAVTTLMLWLLCAWRPQFIFSTLSARRLFRFGGYLLASALLDISYNRLYTLLIGRLYGARELAFYNQADTTKQLPVGVLTGILGRVAFPLFSAAAHDPGYLRKGVRLSLRAMMLLNAPMMCGLAAVSKPLILFLFGPRWLPASSFLQILAIAGMFWPLHVINLNVLMAQGHSHVFFRLEIAKKVIGVLLLMFGAFYGPMGIAWSQAIFGPLAFVINARYSKKFLGYGVYDQLRDFFPLLAVSIVMAGAVYYIGSRLNGLSDGLQLGAEIAAGFFLFLALGWALRLSALRDVVDFFRKNMAPAI